MSLHIFIPIIIIIIITTTTSFYSDNLVIVVVALRADITFVLDGIIRIIDIIIITIISVSI